jgi:hypothetical protein
MITIKPIDGTNPGFAAIPTTAIAAVNYSDAVITVKGDEHPVKRIDFVGKDKAVFASMNDYGRSLAYIILEDDGKRPLGSFLTGESNVEFPAKGTLYSQPMEGDANKGTSASGREWQRHSVHLKGVKFKDFKVL